MVKRKPVLQLDLNTGEIIKEYPHMGAANIVMGVCPRQVEIRRVCRGEKPSDFGFGWRFKEDYKKENKRN